VRPPTTPTGAAPDPEAEWFEPDVVVVGAGPAGASAAYHLARRERRVLLLERRRFPRDKSCGDGLTRPTVRLLTEMGVLADLPDAQRVRGVRVFMRGHGSREFEYPQAADGHGHGLVVPRLDLDERICRRAVAAGATLWEGAAVTGPLMADGVVTGVRMVRRGHTLDITAPVVVAADGSASALGRTAGLVAADSAGLGFAVRSYWTDLDGLSDWLEIFMPLLDPTDQYLLPSYGWIFPTGPRTANVGVGLFSREPTASLRQLLEAFVGSRQAEDPRFRTARQAGPWKGAPLRFDFAPDRCAAPGLVLVGDAAGMVSPFTGEGISYALESGKLAADVIDRNLPRGARTAPDLSDYPILLERDYGGYFETGRTAARRYLLVWRVLESTFESERPPFVLCRRAVLFPEGVGEPYASRILDDVGPLVARGALRVREDLLGIGEVLISTVRRDWPFLARLSAARQGDPGIPFRPGLLLLLAAACGGAEAPGRIQVGAAVELGYLAALAQLGVEDDRSATPPDEQTANWGNMFAILLGDFLFSKACQLSAEAGGEVLDAVCEAVARACEGWLQEVEHAYDLGLTQAEHLAIITRKTATLFELPCRLGALLSQAAPAHRHALASYGHHLGIAFQLADDALDLAGHPGQLGKTVASDLREGTYSLAVLEALAGPDGGERLAGLLRRARLDPDSAGAAIGLVRASGAIDRALATARGHAAQAQAALGSLPPGPATATLARLADYAVTREVPEAADLAAAFGPED
jgi:menaquinone-9 beta-reductase